MMNNSSSKLDFTTVWDVIQILYCLEETDDGSCPSCQWNDLCRKIVNWEVGISLGMDDDVVKV
jgi:hypothetical protein